MESLEGYGICLMLANPNKKVRRCCCVLNTPREVLQTCSCRPDCHRRPPTTPKPPTSRHLPRCFTLNPTTAGATPTSSR